MLYRRYCHIKQCQMFLHSFQGRVMLKCLVLHAGQSMLLFLFSSSIAFSRLEPNLQASIIAKHRDKVPYVYFNKGLWMEQLSRELPQFAPYATASHLWILILEMHQHSMARRSRYPRKSNTLPPFTVFWCLGRGGSDWWADLGSVGDLAWYILLVASLLC